MRFSRVFDSTLVRQFLNEVDSKGECHFPTLGLYCQPIESQMMRQWLGMTDSQTGVLVNKVMPLGTCGGTVERNDVLVQFDGHSIGCDGTVVTRGLERTSYEYLVSGRQVHDEVTLQVIRDRDLIDVNVTLKSGKALVPIHNCAHALVAIMRRICTPYCCSRS